MFNSDKKYSEPKPIGGIGSGYHICIFDIKKVLPKEYARFEESVMMCLKLIAPSFVDQKGKYSSDGYYGEITIIPRVSMIYGDGCDGYTMRLDSVVIQITDTRNQNGVRFKIDHLCVPYTTLHQIGFGRATTVIHNVILTANQIDLDSEQQACLQNAGNRLFNSIAEWIASHQTDYVIYSHDPIYSPEHSVDMHLPELISGMIAWLPQRPVAPHRQHDADAWSSFRQGMMERVCNTVYRLTGGKLLRYAVHYADDENEHRYPANGKFEIISRSDSMIKAFSFDFDANDVVYYATIDVGDGKMVNIAQHTVWSVNTDYLAEIIYQLNKIGIDIKLVADLHNAFSFVLD
jgi:hypothetical protein